MSKAKRQTLVVDNGREYHTREFVEGCMQRGVEVVYQTPSSPLNKSRAERAMRAAQVKTSQAKA